MLKSIINCLNNNLFNCVTKIASEIVLPISCTAKDKPQKRPRYKLDTDAIDTEQKIYDVLTRAKYRSYQRSSSWSDKTWQ